MTKEINDNQEHKANGRLGFYPYHLRVETESTECNAQELIENMEISFALAEKYDDLYNKQLFAWVDIFSRYFVASYPTGIITDEDTVTLIKKFTDEIIRMYDVVIPLSRERIVTTIEQHVKNITPVNDEPYTLSLEDLHNCCYELRRSISPIKNKLAGNRSKQLEEILHNISFFLLDKGNYISDSSLLFISTKVYDLYMNYKPMTAPVIASKYKLFKVIILEIIELHTEGEIQPLDADKLCSEIMDKLNLIKATKNNNNPNKKTSMSIIDILIDVQK